MAAGIYDYVDGAGDFTIDSLPWALLICSAKNSHSNSFLAFCLLRFFPD